MKPLSFLVLLLLAGFVSLAGSKIIRNPQAEFQRSGIQFITQIELTDTATLLTIDNRFLPKWWISNDTTDYIQCSFTGKKYPIKAVVGGKFGEKIWMPASGDSTIVLAFAPLDPSVTKIDYPTAVYGVSLSSSKKTAKKNEQADVAIQQWLAAEVEKSPVQTLPDFDADAFFKTDTAWLVGCIKGYDPRCEISTAMIHCQQVFKRENNPVAVKIKPDGRFKAAIPMWYPTGMSVVFDRFGVPFYLEPGQTLQMTLDWQDFLDADRYRNRHYSFHRTRFAGPLAAVNQEMLDFEDGNFDYKQFEKLTKTATPDSVEQILDDYLATEQMRLQDYASKNKLNPKTLAMLEITQQLQVATRRFDFVMKREYESRTDSTNAVLKVEVQLPYYDFLQKLPLDKNVLLTSGEFPVFINRFEYMSPLRFIGSSFPKVNPKPEISLYAWLVEQQVPLTEIENSLLLLNDKAEKTEEDKAELQRRKEEFVQLGQKYQTQLKAYIQKYIEPFAPKPSDGFLHRWNMKDSLLQIDLGLQSGLVYEIAKVRSLKFEFDRLPKEEAEYLWSNFKKSIAHPVLLAAGDEMFAAKFLNKQAGSYDLPKGEATDVFRKIIAPFKGKVLFVDFWATTCGPCVGSIKKMKEIREKYKGNPDFEFIFIADERSSPESVYSRFVEEQELEHTHRITLDEFNLLRQLFKINGIPRYVVIDREGNVLDEDFQMHNFEFELEKVLSASKITGEGF